MGWHDAAPLYGKPTMRPCSGDPLFSTYEAWLRLRRRPRRDMVCDRWLGDARRDGFEALVEDVGPRPSWRHVLTRPDSSKLLGPANAEWRFHAVGRRRLARHPVGDIGLAQAARVAGLSLGTVAARIHRGWSVETALGTPARPRRKSAD